jgi:hypothetical protein
MSLYICNRQVPCPSAGFYRAVFAEVEEMDFTWRDQQFLKIRIGAGVFAVLQNCERVDNYDKIKNHSFTQPKTLFTTQMDVAKLMMTLMPIEN